MSYTQQVAKSHYLNRRYNNVRRFISYFNQVDSILAILENKVGTVLEIGKGNGLVGWYLKELGLQVKTFDIASDLYPDYIGDLSQIQTIVHEKFDVICAFEVLEHIKYENIENILHQMAAISNKYVIISLPQFSFVFSFWFSISRLGAFKKYIRIPFPVVHKFDGEHYWELGKKGFSLSSFRKLLQKEFIVQKEFTDPLDTYHRFFILEKKFSDIQT